MKYLKYTISAGPSDLAQVAGYWVCIW